jgi:RHS repeat-associated protein
MNCSTKLIKMHAHRSFNEGGNGRVYDPVLGQFLSPDPFVSDPSSTLSYNRYAYCNNNPLKYIDPSGYNAIDNTNCNEGYYPGDGEPVCGNGIGGGSFPDIMNMHNGETWVVGTEGSGWVSNNDYVTVYSNGEWNAGALQALAETGDISTLVNGLSLIYGYRGSDYSRVVYESGNMWLTAATDNRTNMSGYYIVVTNGNSFSSVSSVWDNGNAKGQGGMTGIPGSDAFKYGVAGVSVWGYTIETGFDAARVIQRTVSTWSKGARIMGRSNTVLTAVTIGYDFSTGTANTSTLVNAGVNVAGAITIGIVGITAAPYVAGGLALYGIISIAGGDDWLNSHFDISNKINFMNSPATIYRGENYYGASGSW